MARGFESKDVEYQQAERERSRSSPRPPSTPAPASSRRGAVLLSLARLRSERASARVPAHRAMIEQAIATLEAELASVE